MTDEVLSDSVQFAILSQLLPSFFDMIAKLIVSKNFLSVTGLRVVQAEP